MQTEDELLFTSSILDCPPLMTPNIVSAAPPVISTYDPLHSNNENQPTSYSPSNTTTETTSSTSSANVKVSKIEDQLKQSLSEPRKPTPSPFQAISSTHNVFILDKPTPVDDGATIEVPSTADVVKELEALTNTDSYQVKTLINESQERETAARLNGNTVRREPSPTLKGVTVSPPKKSFLFRSQSHTEPASPLQSNTNLSQSQKTNHDNSFPNTQNGFEDENSMGDTVNKHFTRIPDLISITHIDETNNQQFKPTIENGTNQQVNSLSRIDQSGLAQSVIKQQTIIINNKRTYVNTIPQMTKTNTITIPPSSLNEVTSTDQSSSVKRQRTGTVLSNPIAMNFRPSTETNTSPSNASTGAGSDDQRKKQIRDSNREAARRCRERRRQYIEQLEGNLEQHKGQIKQLTEKLARTERENNQFRTILSETKLLHPSSRLSQTDSRTEYANVITGNGLDLQSNSTNEVPITRNYL